MNIDLQAREIQPLRHTFDRVARYTGGDKPASRYLEATLGAQPCEHFHYQPTWEAGYALFDPRRSAIVMEDWDTLRDPRQYYYATWTMARARQQDAMEASYQFVESRQLVQKMPDALRAQACAVLMPLRHVAFGGNMNNSQICARGYGAVFTAPAMLHAMDQLGVVQYLTRLGLALEGSSALAAGKQDWLHNSSWQTLRRYVEDTLVVQDPMELFVAQNLALDGLLYPLFFTHYVDDQLALQGGTAVAMLSSFIPEWHTESARWVDAVTTIAAAESAHNRELLSQWYGRYTEQACAALAPVAGLALTANAEQALADVRTALNARARKAGLDV